MFFFKFQKEKVEKRKLKNRIKGKVSLGDLGKSKRDWAGTLGESWRWWVEQLWCQINKGKKCGAFGWSE
jgi:hypothetical protein